MVDCVFNLDDFLFCFQFLCLQFFCYVFNQWQVVVLVLIVCWLQFGLLLIQCLLLLCKYVGQVVFFGGVVDNIDVMFIVVVLCEVQEEVVILLEVVEVIGVLLLVDSVIGFQVMLVVGIIFLDLYYYVSQDEVFVVFEMLFVEVLCFGCYYLFDIYCWGNDYCVWFFWYQYYFVWGMIVGIICELVL